MKARKLRDLRFVAIMTLVLMSGLLVTAQNSSLAVPQLIKFSGVVKDAVGHPKAGIVGITFAFYKDQQGGAPLWLETQNVQVDTSGHYTVMLGSTKPDGVPLEVFTSG